MRRLGVCIFLLLIAIRAMAIDAVVSHTIFYRPDSAQKQKLSPYVEISWQVNPNTLHYITTPQNTLQARIKTDITVSSSTGIIKHDKYILETVPVKSFDEVMQHSIIDLRRYNLPAGLVKIRFVLTDMKDSVNRFSFSDSFVVAPKEGKFFFSELQLLDTAYASPGQTVFKKNGMQQVPISTNFMDDARTMFYYYAELYKNGNVTGTDFPILRKIAISKSETEGFFADMIKTDTINSAQEIYQTLGKFNIATLPSGNYYLRASLENMKGDAIASSTLFFQRLNKHPYMPYTSADTSKKSTAMADTGIENVTVLNLKKTFVAKYTLAQIRGILKMLLPFSDQQATRTINGFLKKPDEMYMRYYIYNYFTSLDKDDPGHAWKEFTAKITDVNKRFNSGSTPGYETERGFMYLRYGTPTDIITVENEAGSLPYEIWQYNTLKQLNRKEIPDAMFLFYRPNQMAGEYRLLHSTVEGEVQNVQWRTYLYAGQGGDHSDSRAEQYIGNK